MRTNAWPLVLVIVGLAAPGCSDSPTTPSDPGRPRDPNPPRIPGLVVSEPVGAGGVSYLSVAPGRLEEVVSVRIRNVTGGTAVQSLVPVVDGGFDPVALPASVGDRLELDLLDEAGSARLVGVTVPDRQAPTLVRASLGPDPMSVAVDAPIRLIFSEPLHSATIQGPIAMGAGEWFTSDVRTPDGEPWIVEFALRSTLEPATQYELSLWSGITDLAGQHLMLPDNGGNGFSALWDSVFVTEPPASFEVTETGLIAFVSTRDGGRHIYVVRPDGTGLTRLVAGDAPAWSPDGRWIAFQTPEDGIDDIRVIRADGAGERLLVTSGFGPAWSPDGRRIAFARDGDIFVVNQDGTGEVELVGQALTLARTGRPFALFNPSWSSDGLSIAMMGRDLERATWSVLVANVDGSEIRVLDVDRVDGLTRIVWSPSGSRLLLAAGGEVRSLAADGTAVLAHAHGRRPDWSSAGRLIAYERSRPWRHPGLTRIFLADLDTGRRRLLIPDDPAPSQPSYLDEAPVWSRAR